MYARLFASRVFYAYVHRADAWRTITPTPMHLLAVVDDLMFRSTLEAAGIEFTNGDAPGVRLKKKRR